MSSLDKIIKAINLPKRIVDDAELLLKKLLGPAITQTGELIADQVRYRRFKNQVIIFTKAKELLESKAIEPRQINLKILSPLIDYSSLEEEEKIQNIWANVIANIASYETEQSLNLRCIVILKEITPDEIVLLDFFFNKFQSDEKVTLEKWKNQSWFKDRTSVYPDNSIFAPCDYKETFKMTQEQLDLYVDRLISFGVIRYEQPNLHEFKDNAIFDDSYTGATRSVEFKTYELENSERVHFTNFGLYFVKICKYEK